MKKLLLGLFVFCLLFTGTAVHAGWVSDAVLKEILQFRSSLGASAYNAYPSTYLNTSTSTRVSSTTVAAAPLPTVLTPNGGEIINIGSTYNITWKAPVGVSTVNIYIDTGVRCVVAPCPSSIIIANGVKNTGSYSWYVDPKITYGNGSGLKMVISNGSYSDSSDATFSIAATTIACPPTPSLAQCPTGTTSTLIYDANKCVTGQVCTSDVVACPVGCTCSGTAVNCPVPVENPSVTVLSPNGGEIYNIGDKITIKWTSNNIDPKELVNIYLDIPSQGLDLNLITNTLNDGIETVILPSNITVYGKLYKIKIGQFSTNESMSVSNDFFTINNPVSVCPVPPSLAQCPTGTTGQLTYDSNKCVTGQTCVTNPTPNPTPQCPVGLISKDSCDSVNGTFKTTVDSNGCTITRCVSSATTNVITRTLKMGMRGTDVKILQTFLGLRADGYFGRGTKYKVIQWQKANGLRADGVFGPSSILKSGLGISSNQVCINGATNYPTCTSELSVIANAANPIAQNISISSVNSTNEITGLVFDLKNTSKNDVTIKSITATLGINNSNINAYYLYDSSNIIASLGNPNSTIITFANLPSTLVVSANSTKTLSIKMDVSASGIPGYQSISVASSGITATDSNSNILSSSLVGKAIGLQQTFRTIDVIVTPTTCSNGATNYPSCSISTSGTCLNGGTNPPTCTITPSVDTIAPTIPTNIVATVISSSQINLTWTASTDVVGVTGYNIKRCIGSATCVPVQFATTTSNSYSNTGLTASTLYRYSVSAYDAVPNTSATSSIAQATTSASVVTSSTCGTGGSCTAADIAPHNTRANCWVYMSGAFTTKFTANRAYNITSYVANGNTHPGGDVIASRCGGNLYDYVVGSTGGHAHTSSAINTILQSYYIGPML